MNNNILKIASEVLKIPIEEVSKNSKPLSEIDAFYFWEPVKGGRQVIINENGEKLAAGSRLNLNDMIIAFISGKRN